MTSDSERPIVSNTLDTYFKASSEPDTISGSFVAKRTRHRAEKKPIRSDYQPRVRKATQNTQNTQSTAKKSFTIKRKKTSNKKASSEAITSVDLSLYESESDLFDSENDFRTALNGDDTPSFTQTSQSQTSSTQRSQKKAFSAWLKKHYITIT